MPHVRSRHASAPRRAARRHQRLCRADRGTARGGRRHRAGACLSLHLRDPRIRQPAAHADLPCDLACDHHRDLDPLRAVASPQGRGGMADPESLGAGHRAGRAGGRAHDRAAALGLPAGALRLYRDLHRAVLRLRQAVVAAGRCDADRLAARGPVLADRLPVGADGDRGRQLRRAADDAEFGADPPLRGDRCRVRPADRAAVGRGVPLRAGTARGPTADDAGVGEPRRLRDRHLDDAHHRAAGGEAGPFGRREDAAPGFRALHPRGRDEHAAQIVLLRRSPRHDAYDLMLSAAWQSEESDLRRPQKTSAVSVANRTGPECVRATSVRAAGLPTLASAAALPDLRRALGEFGHHGAALLGTHARPLGDLVDRAQAAGAEPRLGMDDADLDAGALDLVAFPDLVGHGQAPFRWRSRSSAPCRM